MTDDGVIEVLLADDQTLVRDGFRALIDREPDMKVVAEAADGVEAIALTRRHSPDVVLMDIRMPNIDGLTATTRVLALPQPPRVLVLTTFDRNEWVYDALRAGASGFLLKDVRGGQLTDAIRTVAAGLSNAEIADRLVIGHSTVKTHVDRLLTKLDLRDRVQAVVFATRPASCRQEARPHPEHPETPVRPLPSSAGTRNVRRAAMPQGRRQHTRGVVACTPGPPPFEETRRPWTRGSPTSATM
jgi:DNA-binding NarL/FixJ family response regulator